MHWIITTDRINDAESSCVNKLRASKAFIETLRAASPKERACHIGEFNKSMTDEFRLYDDDENLYFEGLCLDLDNQDGDSAFEPLDWAEQFGCVGMKYRKVGEKEWKWL